MARAGDLVCLWGDLGAGKTHLAKAFGAGLGVTETITSPSFILMAEYQGRLPLFHIDPYRLAGARTRSPAASSTSASATASRSSSGRSGSATRCRWPGSTSASTGPATSRARSRWSPGRTTTGATWTSRHDPRRPPPAILAIDTATTRVVIATGSPDGVADGVSTWAAGYRHGETLLPSIGRFLGEQNIRRSRLAGIVVGTGPGAFTGLRVGIATAKGLAHGLGIPLVGVSTAEALLEAFGLPRARRAGAPTVLLLPAGPSDRLVVRAGPAPVPLPAGEEPDLAPGERLVAVDLEGRAPRRRARARRDGPRRPRPGAASRRRGRWRTLTADGPATVGARDARPRVRHPAARRPRDDRTVAWSRDPR